MLSLLVPLAGGVLFVLFLLFFVLSRIKGGRAQ